jgi:hypothetical protein
MTNSNATFPPVVMLEEHKQQRRTPSPEEVSSNSFSGGVMMAEYSPTPWADASSQSSPGSASDHMGVLPTTTTRNSTGIQPLFPGSSVLAAFDAGNHTLLQDAHHGSGHSSGTTTKSPVVSRRKGAAAGGTTNGASGPTNRRQSRLQRNRESARLSRKRRKHYLELLEERVDKLSETLDVSRRQHAADCVSAVHQKRSEFILQGNATAETLKLLENNLTRTNEELMIATTFQFQQLKAFSMPPSTQFILWLTLQTDTYFRGGRTASERLSAARIGERVRFLVSSFLHTQNESPFALVEVLISWSTFFVSTYFP